MERTELLKMAREYDLPELEYRLSEYWDDDEREQEELTNVQYAIREAEWVVEDIEEDNGHCLHDEWLDAKALLRRTKNGKVRPLDMGTWKIKEGYRDEDIERARDIIDEPKRTKKFIRKLRRLA